MYVYMVSACPFAPENLVLASPKKCAPNKTALLHAPQPHLFTMPFTVPGNKMAPLLN